MARGNKSDKGKNGANLRFEQTLWQAADKLRSNEVIRVMTLNGEGGGR